MVMAMVMVTMMMMTDNDDDDHMLDNANAWAPHLSWWVGSIEEKEAQSVLRITPRLMNLFKGPSETSMYFKLHPPACYAVSLQQQLRETTLGDENGSVEVEFCGSRRFFEEYRGRTRRRMLYSADPPLPDQLQNSEIQNIVNILQRNAVYLL